jgi:hypothetical protein
VWYEFVPEDRTFLVVGRERADWIAHIRRIRASPSTWRTTSTPSTPG